MTDLRRKSAQIADALKSGESVRLTEHGKTIGMIVPESQEAPMELEQVSSPVFEEMLAVQREILAELRAPRETVKHDPAPEDTWPRCDCGRPVSEHHEAFLRKMCAACLLAEQVPEEPAAEEEPEEAVQEPQEPVQRPEPSERQLAYAQDFYGLQEAEGEIPWVLTEKGVNNALGTMKKHVRNGDELAMEISSRPEDDPERQAYLLLLQIQKYDSCLAKLRDGDPNWVAGGPSS